MTDLVKVLNKGVIYKLCCSDISVTEIYIGSTKSLRNRKARHKSACTNSADNEYCNKLYSYIRANGGWVNWDLRVIETIEYSYRHELLMRERYWIEQLKASLNCNMPIADVDKRHWCVEHHTPRSSCSLCRDIKVNIEILERMRLTPSNQTERKAIAIE